MNFGECHSFGSNPDLIGGFISAIYSISDEIAGSKIKSIHFENNIFHFYKSDDTSNLLYVFITDLNDKIEDINFKVREIASFFSSNYSTHLQNFNGEVSLFKNFKNLLFKMNLAQENCGVYSKCLDCPNNTKRLGALDKYEDDKEGFFQRLESYFKKDEKV